MFIYYVKIGWDVEMVSQNYSLYLIVFLFISLFQNVKTFLIIATESSQWLEISIMSRLSVTTLL